MIEKREINIHNTPEFDKWLGDVTDALGKAAILSRLDRLALSPLMKVTSSATMMSLRLAKAGMMLETVAMSYLRGGT